MKLSNAAGAVAIAKTLTLATPALAEENKGEKTSREVCEALVESIETDMDRVLVELVRDDKSTVVRRTDIDDGRNLGGAGEIECEFENTSLRDVLSNDKNKLGKVTMQITEGKATTETSTDDSRLDQPLTFKIYGPVIGFAKNKTIDGDFYLGESPRSGLEEKLQKRFKVLTERVLRYLKGEDTKK